MGRVAGPVASTSATGESLAVGPQGPAGPPGPAGPAGLAGTTQSCNAAASPFSAAGAYPIVGVDTTAGPVTVNLPPGLLRVFLKNIAGPAFTNPITVIAPAGMTIESTTVPQSFGASSTIANTGSSWEWVAIGTQLCL